MGLIRNLAKQYLGLNETDRQAIYKLFGSFRANNLLANEDAYLKQGYETNVDVFAVIKKLVDVTNSVPYIIEQRTADGWEILEDSTLADLMANPNPNKGYTWKDIDEQLLIYLLAAGNGYLVGETGLLGSRIDEVDVLPSPFVTVNTSNDFFLPNPKYKFDLNN